MNDPRLWFHIARRDFGAAHALLLAAFQHQAAYYAHQAAEKTLKGFLITKQGNIKKTHNLKDLVAICVPHNARFASLKKPAYFLNDYATRSRYPGEDYEKDLKGYETEVLIGHSKKIISFVFKILFSPDFP